MKDWDAVVKALSSPESSDCEDVGANYVSVMKNTRRTADLVSQSFPFLSALTPGSCRVTNPPMGRNRPIVPGDSVKASLDRQSVPTHESRSEGGPPSEAEEKKRGEDGKEERAKEASEGVLL